MVSGTMALTEATLKGGSAGIRAQRGDEIWGASWAFASGGAQGDILTLSDVLNNLSTSGAYATDAELLAVSGALRAVLDASGANLASASGAIVTNISGLIVNVSGTIVASGQYFNQPTIASGVMYGRITLDPSGTVTIGTASAPLTSGFASVVSANGIVYQLRIGNDGLVSGFIV
ncbi:MAG TPA: hypothetical protein VI911_10940 [Patescibacteria group bacterium]|nr:hypothetical protein [Patescibacteria group bacterium]